MGLSWGSLAQPSPEEDEVRSKGWSDWLAQARAKASDPMTYAQHLVTPALGMAASFETTPQDVPGIANRVVAQPLVESGKGVLDQTGKGLRGEPVDPGKMTFDIFNTVPLAGGVAELGLSAFGKKMIPAAPGERAFGAFGSSKGGSDNVVPFSPRLKPVITEGMTGAEKYDAAAKAQRTYEAPSDFDRDVSLLRTALNNPNPQARAKVAAVWEQLSPVERSMIEKKLGASSTAPQASAQPPAQVLNMPGVSTAPATSANLGQMALGRSTKRAIDASDNVSVMPGVTVLGANRSSSLPLLSLMEGKKPRAASKLKGAAQAELPEPPPAPPFYSAVGEALSLSPQTKATGAQWLGTLRNTKGVKPEEIDWLGLNDFAQQPSVTKQQLLERVRERSPQVNDDLLGPPIDKPVKAPRAPKSVPFDMSAATSQEIDDVLARSRDNWRNLEADMANRYGEFPAGSSRDQQLNRHFPLAGPHLDRILARPGTLAPDAIREAAGEAAVLLRQPEIAAKKTVKERKPSFPKTVYEKYSEPGGQNYRELLMKLPPSKGHYTENFSAPHFSGHDENLLAHIRMKDRVIDGKKTLFLEEMQSDWHQKGRKSGYRGDPIDETPRYSVSQHGEHMDGSPKFIAKDDTGSSRIFDKEAEAQKWADDQNHREIEVRRDKQIPNAPLKKSWHDMALKRAVKWAADNGYDQVAWTGGKQQANRYGLSQHVKHISWEPSASGLQRGSKLKNVALETKTAGRLHLGVDGDGKITGSGSPQGQQFVGHSLDEVIGKDMAVKIMNDDKGLLEGAGLEIGGEGMKGFYDKILPNSARKLGKDYDANVMPMKMDVGDDNYSVSLDNGSFGVGGATVEAAQARAETLRTAHRLALSPKVVDNRPDIWGMPITDKLRAQARNKGFPLFANSKKAAPLAMSFSQYKNEYPPLGEPTLMKKQSLKGIASGGYSKAGKAEPWGEKVTSKQADKLVEGGEAFWQKNLSPEAEEFQKARNTIQKDIDKGNYNPYFKLEARYDANPSDFPKFEDTTNIRKARPDTQKKYDDIANDPSARAKLDAAFDEGLKSKELSGNWYQVGQLADEYKKVYGAEEGAAAFKKRFADSMAATTGGADPTANLLTSHYGNFLEGKGQATPKSYNMPFPIGGRYISGNMEQFDKMIRGDAGVTPANPKRYNFSGAFQGNKGANTIDEQMSSPYGMTMPPAGSYGHFQSALDRFAADKGVDPRYYQEVTWAGLKKSKGKPMMQVINEAVERTARLTGVSPEEVVREALVKRARPLYSNAPSAGVVPFGFSPQGDERE